MVIWQRGLGVKVALIFFAVDWLIFLDIAATMEKLGR